MAQAVKAYISDHGARIEASREWGNFMASGYGEAALIEARRILAETEPHVYGDGMRQDEHVTVASMARWLTYDPNTPEVVALIEALAAFVVDDDGDGQ